MAIRLLLLAGLLGCCGCDGIDSTASELRQRESRVEPQPAATGNEPAAEGSVPEAGSSDPQTSVPGEQPSAEQRPAVPAKPAATRDVTFDDIKFEMEKGGTFERSMLTPEVEALMGQPIRIRGYILPSFQQSGLTQFVLVRDNMECCFGPGAALYDCVVVEMEPGRSADFTVRPVTVEGVFSFNELQGFDGNTVAIYQLRGRSVR